MRRAGIIAACLLLPGCSFRPANTIVIGSKNFSEQVVLAELLAQRVEDTTPVKVERRFYLGGTYICQQSLLAGRIDAYVEYTGTALAAILKQHPGGSPEEIYSRVKTEYAKRYALAVMKPLGFNNSFAIVIRGDQARKLHLHTISEAAKYSPHWRAAFGYEFLDRADGYAGLVRTYGLKFAVPPLSMDLGLLYRALISKQVDLIAGNTTDGQIEAYHLVILKDDRHYFPPYWAVPILRRRTLNRYAALRSSIDGLAGMISNKDMREMNYEVVGQHRDVSQVVREFLASKHLNAAQPARSPTGRSVNSALTGPQYRAHGGSQRSLR
jgi:glycine betaine/choline ABC-type transport system substrate-binding protein